jgi:eukaryotic-like serine/threonine-protein kinase
MERLDSAALVGRRLGRYGIGELIGRGGMGMVYRARDSRARRDVALKVLGAASGQEAIDRFQREALWLSYCDGPHIVPVYDTGRVDGVDYIAMELMATTLQSRIRDGRASIGDVVSVGVSILFGLAVAHRAGIVHRDIKPANVGISATGVIKLLDFGVANPLPWSAHDQNSGTSPPTPFVGTLDYMSPEQLRGDRLDERGDIYSTGAVLYELATGSRPFPEVRPACLIDAILNATPPAPSALRAELPPALDEVLLTALEKLRARRYRSALAMVGALRTLDPRPAPPARARVVRSSPGPGGRAVSSASVVIG